MIKRWNEVSTSFFKEVFDCYWNKESGTEEKVIEFQNLASIYNDQPETRLFIGSGINIQDWREYNKSFLDIYDSLVSMAGQTLDSKLSLCILESNPNIIPFGAIPSHYDLMLGVCLGCQEVKDSMDPTVLQFAGLGMKMWFQKDGDGKYVWKSEYDSTLEEPYLRLRIWDYSDWKDMMKRYIDSGMKFPSEYMETDLGKTEIQFYS